MSENDRENSTTRNALEAAVDHMEQVFGAPGLAALRLFLDALPSDATITWTYSGKLQWSSTAKLALELQEDLASG